MYLELSLSGNQGCNHHSHLNQGPYGFPKSLLVFTVGIDARRLIAYHQGQRLWACCFFSKPLKALWRII